MPIAHRIRNTVFVALLTASSLAALAPAAEAAPCYSSSDYTQWVGSCGDKAVRTTNYVLCLDGSCFGAYPFVVKEHQDVSSAVDCAQSVPLGADRCLDDRFKDPLGFNVDRLVWQMVFVYQYSSGWLGVPPAPPVPGVPPALGPTVRDEVSLVLIP